MTPPRPHTADTPTGDVLETPARPDSRWYPIRPLMDTAGIRTMAGLRAVFAMNGEQYRRLLDHGLTELQADRWAVRLGLSPLEVWPDFGMVPCEGCGTPFAQRRAGHRFCSEPCRQNTYRRRRYHTDDAFAERRRQQARAYYEECGEVARAKQRRRDRARAAARREDAA